MTARRPAKPKRAARSAPAAKRVLKVEATRQRLFDAALKVVGELGYSGSSIAKITERAKVAQGTFYNYFSSQQDLFDQLLPHLGNQLLDEIRVRLQGRTESYEREEIGFRAYFDFLAHNPEFERIYAEAEIFTPQGFHQHVENIARGYMRAFRHSQRNGQLPHYTERELEAVTHILLGARNFLSKRYMSSTHGTATAAPLADWVVRAYMKFMRYGLTGPRRALAVAATGGHKGRPEIADSIERHDRRATVSRFHAADGGTSGFAFLADLAQHTAALSLAPPGQAERLAPVHFSCSLLATPTEGPVMASAVAEGGDSAAIVVQVQLTQDGRPIAQALASYSRRIT